MTAQVDASGEVGAGREEERAAPLMGKGIDAVLDGMGVQCSAIADGAKVMDYCRGRWRVDRMGEGEEAKYSRYNRHSESFPDRMGLVKVCYPKRGLCKVCQCAAISDNLQMIVQERHN